MSTPYGQPGLALTVARRAIIWALLGLLIPVVIPSLIAWREQERSRAMSSPTSHGAEADLCRTARVLVLVAVLLDSVYLVALAWATLI